MGAHGNGPHPIIEEPAFEKFYKFRETAGERFKVTNRNLFPIFILMVAIPVGLTYVSYESQGKWLRYPLRRDKPVYDTEFKP